MEFKSLKNIESSFKQIRLFGMVFLCLCAVVAVFSVIKSYQFARSAAAENYILDGGKSLSWPSRKTFRKIVRSKRKSIYVGFTSFFLRSPDRAAIESNINRALFWWIRVPLRIIRIFRKRVL